ncbi:HNH endonuclease [Algisphaera agarilytica]|uniref:5-methylcytosine-specific restriction endonuclease McrA n=1 Tax=Algisphaera agarilytica TaxID=1385975 RepID=A0A7X0H623_9BACT|nr:HNH endonuclease [Algisphaera agarilytica]MBB6429904.1 5-methylcytosine-specific restriction endonuclease McrA [Algisphaera agarilytica]
MTAALQSDMLVLNKHWRALRIITAAEALADLFVGRVEAVDTDYQSYDFASWHELSEYASEFEPEDQHFVQTVTSAVLVPVVVRLLHFDRVTRPTLRLSRRNVYLRDDYTCQYTGKRLPSSELNLDHIVPTSRGGKTTWENLVCCSVGVNSLKGDKTPEEAGLKLIRLPRRPDATELLFKSRRERHDSWKHFVDAAYWNTELHD